MSEITYRNPKENMEREEDTIHTVEICDDNGEMIARAELTYFSNPIPYYQVSEIYTEHAYQGKGYASKIMEFIENMLIRKKRAGFLVDAILPGHPASGFYERRGWKPVPGGVGQYVYNLPKGVGVEKFVHVQWRQTPVLERQNSENDV